MPHQLVGWLARSLARSFVLPSADSESEQRKADLSVGGWVGDTSVLFYDEGVSDGGPARRGSS